MLLILNMIERSDPMAEQKIIDRDTYRAIKK